MEYIVVIMGYIWAGFCVIATVSAFLGKHSAEDIIEMFGIIYSLPSVLFLLGTAYIDLKLHK